MTWRQEFVSMCCALPCQAAGLQQGHARPPTPCRHFTEPGHDPALLTESATALRPEHRLLPTLRCALAIALVLLRLQSEPRGPGPSAQLSSLPLLYAPAAGLSLSVSQLQERHRNHGHLHVRRAGTPGQLGAGGRWGRRAACSRCAALPRSAASPSLLTHTPHPVFYLPLLQGGEDPLSLPPHGTEIFIGGLPRGITEQQLRDFASEAGDVHSARLIRDPNNPSQNRGYGFVKWVLGRRRWGAAGAAARCTARCAAHPCFPPFHPPSTVLTRPCSSLAHR